MTLIEKEQKAANEIKFKFTKNDNGLVALTPDNVAIVEVMIKNNSEYLKSSDPDAVPIESPKSKEYLGSTAYWMTQLKKFINDKRDDDYYKVIIRKAVAAVDRENSTHLNADGVGRDQISERIIAIFEENNLSELLRTPETNGFSLIEKIAKETKPDTQHNARVNLSFASKFCHYACFYLFDGKEEQDNFPIYDNVLQYAIKKYDPQFKAFDKNSGNAAEYYKKYRETVDTIIREQASNKISRNGFDHLLWYYYKGRM